MSYFDIEARDFSAMITGCTTDVMPLAEAFCPTTDPAEFDACAHCGVKKVCEEHPLVPRRDFVDSLFLDVCASPRHAYVFLDAVLPQGFPLLK